MSSAADIDRDVAAPARPSLAMAFLGFVGTTAVAVLFLLLVNGLG